MSDYIECGCCGARENEPHRMSCGKTSIEAMVSSQVKPGAAKAYQQPVDGLPPCAQPAEYASDAKVMQ